jgi:hypothetical protein
VIRNNESVGYLRKSNGAFLWLVAWYYTVCAGSGDGDKEFEAGLMVRDSLCVNDNDIGEDQTV